MQAAVFEFAGTAVEVQYINGQIPKYFKNYISAGTPEIKISITESDIKREKLISEQFAPQTVYPDWYYEILAVHRKFCSAAVKKGIILFHSSAIAVDGEAYLFTAPSGTGKSTHARLWREMLGDRAVMINDDKPLLRFAENKIYVYGSPWNGKHRLDSNICVPLKGICILEQGAENRIKKITPTEAFARLCKQVYFHEDRTEYVEVIKLVGELAKSPVYIMQCNVSREAAELSYHTMKENM